MASIKTIRPSSFQAWSNLSDSSEQPGDLVQGVEEALEPHEVTDHLEDPEEAHHPHHADDLAGLTGGVME